MEIVGMESLTALASPKAGVDLRRPRLGSILTEEVSGVT